MFACLGSLPSKPSLSVARGSVPHKLEREALLRRYLLYLELWNVSSGQSMYQWAIDQVFPSVYHQPLRPCTSGARRFTADERHYSQKVAK